MKICHLRWKPWTHLYGKCAPPTNSNSSFGWKLLRSKILEGEMLPHSQAAMLPHLMKANCMVRRDKTNLIRCQNLPPVERNGWEVKDGMYIPVRCLILSAPWAVIELTKCGCKCVALHRFIPFILFAVDIKTVVVTYWAVWNYTISLLSISMLAVLCVINMKEHVAIFFKQFWLYICYMQLYWHA